MLIKRKEFLQLGSLATASCLIPKFMKGLERNSLVPAGNKVLVVVQFSGGNDGLNTVIPVTNDIYYRERPRIGIKKDNAHTLTQDASLHTALTYFKELYDEGNLAILNGVGYPDPHRSHFRSMDIWQSASASNEYLNTGWLGRYLDAQCKGCDKPTQAMEIDDVLSLALKGELSKGMAFKDPQRLYQSSNSAYYKNLSNHHDHHEETVDYLYKTMSETLSSAQYIFDKSKLHAVKSIYPATEIGKSLKTISSLILSDINTRVYYVSIGSFDTHTAQDTKQTRLFAEINNAIKPFVADMKANGRFEDVLMMTFSEFGRRVSQNASNGTDHGTANNMFFIGGGLKKKGLLNALPDLSNLNDGDLKYTVDFKNVYATVLQKWLDADDQKILGKNFSMMDFI